MADAVDVTMFMALPRTVERYAWQWHQATHYSPISEQSSHSQGHGSIGDVIAVVVNGLQGLTKGLGASDLDGVGRPLHLGAHQLHHLNNQMYGHISTAKAQQY